MHILIFANSFHTFQVTVTLTFVARSQIFIGLISMQKQLLVKTATQLVFGVLIYYMDIFGIKTTAMKCSIKQIRLFSKIIIVEFLASFFSHFLIHFLSQ